MNIAGSLTQTGTSNNFIFGKTTFNSNLVVSANNRLYAIGSVGIGYADNAALNSNFNVLGTADFSSNINIAGSLTQTGTSNNFIFGKTTFNSNLVVSANNRLYAIGRVGIGYADNAALNSNFNVLGTADFSSNMNIAGSLTQTGTSNNFIFGKTTFNSNLVVSANNRLYAIGSVGVGYADNAALNSNFNVLGTADFSSNMNVGGSLTQTGTSNNFIFGKTTFNSNLVVSANNRLYAIGRVGIGYADNAALNSNFNVLGTADFSSNMNIGGELFCSNNIRENSRYLRDIYLNSNLLNNIKKKYGFLCVLSGLTTNPPYTENINGITYYKYDIDLTKYTQLKYLSDTSPYRIFNIKTFMTSGYFNLFNSNIPNILQYDIYMCNEISANPNLPGSSAGINICAIGTPENYRLTNILPTYFTILQNNSFNKLSIISTIPSLNVSCIIEDYLF
jgi:hypothetical protein